VREAYPDIRFITELRYEGKPHLTTVAGLPFSAKNNDAFDGMQGNFFSSETAPEIILQKAFAEELLSKRAKPGAEDVSVAELARPLLGQELVMRYTERVASPGGPKNPPSAGERRLSASNEGDDLPQASYSVFFREQKLKIVGVSDLDPDSMRGAARARVFLPLTLAENLHVMQPSNLRDSSRGATGSPTYATVSVRVTSPKYVQPVEDAIRKMGFNTFSITDATRSLRQFFAVLDLFLGIFGSLALAVASIGIVNTLVMAILERRREIGIMKALGASDTDVKKLFFAEAGAMGVMGGAVGVALGWMIGRVINIGTNVYLRRQNFPPEQIWAVPWWLVGGAIVFAILVSLASGIYPAGRAAKLDPVQALRYE
jgi:putative ABC transport system permease protein